jgi:hypothetical protein
LNALWARRPQAAVPAVIFCQMADDPSAVPEEFPSDESQEHERLRLFALISELVTWENTTASVRLDSVTAGPQVGKFLDEVMSHLQALPGVNIEMTLEVQVRAPGGIDEATARIVLENSAALKVEKPGLY